MDRQDGRTNETPAQVPGKPRHRKKERWNRTLGRGFSFGGWCTPWPFFLFSYIPCFFPDRSFLYFLLSTDQTKRMNQEYYYSFSRERIDSSRSMTLFVYRSSSLHWAEGGGYTCAHWTWYETHGPPRNKKKMGMIDQSNTWHWNIYIRIY